ncbi:outer membrane protein assembly factor BamA [Candidatus Pelagibacter sp.]|nr:outer membrane protein assembly factor BamA [Candidatus Pelagibacter sp.]
MADIINDIIVKNNNRISKQTIITYGNIELNKDYNLSDVNQVFRNLYETDFFESLEIDIVDNQLIINVKENKIIANVSTEGVKSKNLAESILKNTYSKDKSPFLISKVKQDADKIKISLNEIGYYFAEVETKTYENDNDTVNLIFNITTGDRAKISQIEFVGDKKIKDRTLRNVIISEESKFWKFISKKKYLNMALIERDKRLMKNLYLDKGYYDIKITSQTVDFSNDNEFKLTYNIDAGTQYTISSAKLELPADYESKNFSKASKLLKKMENKKYSFQSVSKVVNEIDKISLSRQFEFINAEVIETKNGKDKIDILFKVKESEKFYVERINILGNNITHENVIRNSLEIDEGDPFNELLNAKSLNNLRSLNIFANVKSNVKPGKDINTKIIDLEVTEKPTGEISLGAGYGSEGGTIGFSVTENNFLGKNIKLSTAIRTTEDTIRGSFSVTNPNFNYSNKSLTTSLQNTSIDKMSDSGYKTQKTGFSFGTRYEQYEDTFFSPKIVTEVEDLTTNADASASLKKQTGNYFETKFDYALDFDKRNQRYQTTSGSRTVFNQGIPLVSEEYALLNGFETERWIKFKNDMVTNFGFYGRAIDSINDEDVRVTDRLSLPRNKLKGFQAGRIGPVDNKDYVGGNYVASINFDTTLPMILPSAETIDFKYFVDVGNVWGIDYSDTIDDSNKIRSSTGITIDWFTPIGPLNFSFAKDITKANTDKTESFQFNLGTTF